MKIIKAIKIRIRKERELNLKFSGLVVRSLCMRKNRKQVKQKQRESGIINKIQHKERTVPHGCRDKLTTS